MAEEEARQPAPSPTTMHVPPGKWIVTVVKGNGQLIFPDGIEIEGPLTISIGLAAPE